MVKCPKCKSTQVYSSHVQAFFVNTDEHYCHLVKPHDDDSPSGCVNCGWRGLLKDLVQPTNSD